MGELDDVLTEIRLHRLDARCLQGVVQLDLLCGHGLALHGHAYAPVAAKTEDDVARLVTRGRPVHVPAQPLHVVGEALEMAVEVLERRLLDGAGAMAQRLACRVARKGLLAATDELGGGDGERFLEVGVAEGGVGPLREGCAELGVAHALPSGSSTCARWSA